MVNAKGGKAGKKKAAKKPTAQKTRRKNATVGDTHEHQNHKHRPKAECHILSRGGNVEWEGRKEQAKNMVPFGCDEFASEK
jgi:hypothetical protein